MLIQSFVNLFGTDAIAGNAAALNIESIIYIMLDAVRHTAMTFISQNYGAGEFVRIKKIFRMCIVYAAALNRAGLLQRKGTYPSPEGWLDWMGLEVSGTVESMGRKLKKTAVLNWEIRSARRTVWLWIAFAVKMSEK